MPEQFQNPNTQQPQDIDPGQLDPSLQVPQTAIDSEIARSTQPLQDYMEQGGIGAENRRIAGERVLQIAGIVRDNPERVAADIGKSPHKRTEYDPERAHLIALATDGNMTKLVADNKRIEAGKRIWRRAKHEQNLLGSKMGENMATEVYNDDPIEAGPNAVELRRLLSIRAGGSSYKYIKGAKLPRR